MDNLRAGGIAGWLTVLLILSAWAALAFAIARRQKAYALVSILSALAAGEALPPHPAAPRLHGAPNPFREGTTLTIELVRPGAATLRIHDAGGRLVRTLADGPRGAGRHSIRWDGRDAAGRPVAAGVYFARLCRSDGEDGLTLLRLR